jgi:hypothetical protein
METTLKFLRTDILPRHDRKLNKIQSILENGLSDKVSKLTDVVEGLRRCADRPDDNVTGQPVERRADPPKPKKKFWVDWPISAKITAVIFVLINFPIIYKWGEIITTNFIDVVRSLAGLK